MRCERERVRCGQNLVDVECALDVDLVTLHAEREMADAESKEGGHPLAQREIAKQDCRVTSI